MRPELELIQQIENYLLNNMSEAERSVFESKINADALLKAEVEKQRLLMGAVKRAGVKKQISTAQKKYFMKKNIFKWGLGGAGLLATTLVVLMLVGKNPFDSTGHSDPYALPEVNENNEKVWADADKYLPSQFFEIDNSKDTVIETEGGIVFAIPKGCFLDESGNPVSGKVKLNVKEALKPEDIMRGGMDTRSDGNLLETCGMFYLNPTQDGKNLKIDASRGIYTEVPSDRHKPGMQLFEGERMPDGTINWKNPKPTEKFLIPVNIQSLNFYPPLYLDSLRGMGYDVKNKTFTDSLYYSFARLFGPVTMTRTPADSVRRMSDEIDMETYVVGERIFKANCATCHASDNRLLTGPGLGGVSAKHTKDWLFQFTKNNLAFAKTNKKAREVQMQFPSTMNVFEGVLSDDEIRWVVEYMRSLPESKPITPTVNDTGGYFRGLNPARIKAIWNKEFDNTLIATKEFEERLKHIHQMCDDQGVLDLYVSNLDKKMCTIDSIAAKLDGCGLFLEFAARGEGRVKIKEGHLKKLQEYYAKKSKAYTDAITKTQKKFWEEQQTLDDEALAKLNDQYSKEAHRQAENFKKEFEHNLEDAYRQLGYKRVSIPPAATIGVTVTDPGWKNIDRYVYESTVNRTSVTITDSLTGKTAKILYQPFTLFAGGDERWDRLTAYLLPDSLYSFQRMKQVGFDFKEQINASINYDLISLAYKGDQVYYFEAKNIKQGRLEAQWKRISQDELEKKLSGLKSRGYRKDVWEDIAYTRFEIKEDKRQQKLLKLVELTNRIGKVIFPCSQHYFNTEVESKSESLAPEAVN